MQSSDSLDYKQAGVDTHAGQEFVSKIKPLAAATRNRQVIDSLGGFGAMFLPDFSHYKQPVLVSGTDGVGTKTELARQANQHPGVGIDLLAMCVNDILTCGAKPLFFLDYLAVGALNIEVAVEIVKGISAGCRLTETALIGGETAEHPGLMQDHHYDLAGFIVGVVEKSEMVTGKEGKQVIVPGAKVVGLTSSGVHSNGFSLVRKILEKQAGLSPDKAEEISIQELLRPTHLYVKPVQKLLEVIRPQGMLHVTGGGFYENIPRILPEKDAMIIDRDKLPKPEIFAKLQKAGGISDKEMLSVFNMGVGYILILPPERSDAAIRVLNEACAEYQKDAAAVYKEIGLEPPEPIRCFEMGVIATIPDSKELVDFDDELNQVSEQVLFR